MNARCVRCGLPIQTRDAMACCVTDGCEMRGQPLPIRAGLRLRLSSRTRLWLGAWSAPPPPRCPSCKNEACLRCERCGALQPTVRLRYPELRVAVCGRPGAGKSALTAAMLTALPRAQGVTLHQLAEDDSASRLAREYAEPLFERGDFPMPEEGGMAFGVSRSVWGLPPRACLMGISDLPGTLFESPGADGMRPELARADGLIVAFNPMTLPVLAAHGTSQAEHEAHGQRLLSALRDAAVPGLGARSAQPVALVLTHMDEWLPLARLPGLARRVYDARAVDCESAQLAALLSAWGAEGLSAQLQGFRHARVFGCGVVPGAPAHALAGAHAPLMWLLTQLGA